MITQEQNEKLMMERGAQRMERQRNSNRENGQATRNASERLLVRSLFDEFADILGEEMTGAFDQVRRGAPNKGSKAWEDVSLHTLALFVLDTFVRLSVKPSSTRKQEALFTRVVDNAARDLRIEYTAQNLKRLHPRVWKFLRSTRRTDQRRLDRNMRKQIKDMGLEEVTASLQEYRALVDRAVALLPKLGVARIDTIKSKNRARRYMVLTPEAAQRIADWDANGLYSRPDYCPTTEAPLPWVSASDGGYHQIQVDLMMTRGQEAHRDSVPQGVLDAVNRVQATRWAINEDVMTVLEVALAQEWEGLSSILAEELPEIDQTLEKGTVAYREAAINRDRARSRNISSASRLTAVRKALAEARRYVNEPVIYFVPFLDFRGRMYFRTSGGLDPQGSDVLKSLLTFAEARPVNGEGMEYLKVHGANCIDGVDKLPWADRIAWVDAHEETILRIAEDPISHREWVNGIGEYDVESPFGFLAFCCDYARCLKTGTSSLPCAADATCSGLQIYSGALRDVDGGQQTGLVPSDRPGDIYTHVADFMRRAVEAEDTPLGREVLASGIITRSLVKRPVMTSVYGVTSSGIYNQTNDKVEEFRVKSGEDTIPGISVPQQELVAFLQKHIVDAISGATPLASAAMAAFQGLAAELAKQDTHATWKTPDGMIVGQRYTHPIVTTVRTIMMGDVKGTRRKTSFADDGDQMDKKKSRNSIAPNVVHSLDAALMRETVRRCPEIEDWHMIHDSFAVHAGNAAEMAKAVRSAFVEMMESDCMQEIYATLLSALQGPSEDLEGLPNKGSLDIRGVLESRYFFA